LLAFTMRRRGGQDDLEHAWAQQQAVAMPNFAAQPAAAMPGYPSQPPMNQAVYAPPVQPAPVIPDPARDYYNGLIAQGYPHEDAVRYTQQYFNEFRG